MIDAAVRPLAADPSIPLGTLAAVITDPHEVRDPNVVKVVVDRQGYALYFSRAPIPWDRDRWSEMQPSARPDGGPWYKHIGLYVYRRDFLLSFAATPQTRLEMCEKLEQLRALENGHRIRVVLTERGSLGVDIPDDLSKILQRVEEGGISL
jgi:3-deoxy-manno-octulosonate cytidylyltransferase (CMP-KDO synthetase)